MIRSTAFLDCHHPYLGQQPPFLEASNLLLHPKFFDGQKLLHFFLTYSEVINQQQQHLQLNTSASRRIILPFLTLLIPSATPPTTSNKPQLLFTNIHLLRLLILLFSIIFLLQRLLFPAIYIPRRDIAVLTVRKVRGDSGGYSKRRQ